MITMALDLSYDLSLVAIFCRFQSVAGLQKRTDRMPFVFLGRRMTLRDIGSEDRQTDEGRSLWLLGIFLRICPIVDEDNRLEITAVYELFLTGLPDFIQ